MRSHFHRIAGEEVIVRLVETRDDAEEFRRWGWDHALRPVAVDTEATGLDIYSPRFRLRTVQFGTPAEAWVIPVESADFLREAAEDALRRLDTVLIHNAAFDWLVVDRHLATPLESLAPRTIDTRTLAHLRDPRGRQEGGTGLKLEDLAAVLVDPDAHRPQRELYAAFRELGYTKDTGWPHIPVEHPAYVRYAGSDVLLTARLWGVLAPEITQRGMQRLVDFEREVSRVCAAIQRKGILADPDYLRRLSQRMTDEAERHIATAARYGVDNINSTAQVAQALQGMGERLSVRTAAGKLAVDKTVLLPLADLGAHWERLGVREPNPLADAVARAKRAERWKTSYARAMLAGLDEHNRVHASINSLQARTARMSVSSPPLQQLPNGDSTVRRALIAEPGHVIGSVDYETVEMRVLAALATDTAMIQAIVDGLDLHSYTAQQIFGDDFTAKHRKVAKTVGFAKVYGGGAASIVRQTGASRADIDRAIGAYDRTFRGVRRFTERLEQRGRFGMTELITPSGRVLPVDRMRLYALLNHLVQSSARDVFAQGLLDLDAAGLTDFVRLPVHDEVIFAAPESDMFDVAEAIQDAMTVDDFFGVPLTTEAEIFGTGWTPDAPRFKRTGQHAWQEKEGDRWTPLTETTTAPAA